MKRYCSLRRHSDGQYVQDLPVRLPANACLCAARYNFMAREEEVAVLKTLDLPQLLAAWRAALAPGSATRRKLAIYVAGRSHQGDLQCPPDAGVKAMQEEDAVRSACRMVPQLQGELPPVQG